MFVVVKNPNSDLSPLSDAEVERIRQRVAQNNEERWAKARGTIAKTFVRSANENPGDTAVKPQQPASSQPPESVEPAP